MSDEKPQEKQPNRIQCPGCGAELALQARAAFAPETMTIIYKLEPGRKMAVEELCESLKGLAKSLKLVAKELGVKAMVAIEDIRVKDSEISATVSVVQCH